MIGTIFYPLSRIVTAILVFVTGITGGAGWAAAVGKAPPSLQPMLYPRWVHEHWIYENEGDTDSVLAFVDGFKELGIPVGAVILDRPWEQGDVGSYIADPDRYWDFACAERESSGKPDPACEDCLLCYFQNDGTKVLLWASCMINETAGEVHAYAKDKGYFLSGGKVIKWWGGRGSMIDYTNPEAVKFWEGQLDKVLRLGIDGFKLDGADPYVALMAPAYGKGGLIGLKGYQKLQYGHFYKYTKSHSKNNAILTRATDDLVGWGLPLRFMSREINFSGWVGDRDNDWGGIRQGMNTMFTSALFNYASYGSEIGGFRTDGNQYKDVFIRWAQLGAFSPIMLNGGGGELHRPWLYDEETVDVYRKFTRLHYELIPYISSQVMFSYERNQPTMRPQFGVPYQFMLGDEILMAPFYKESDNHRTVAFPAGSEWIYMFDESKAYKAGVRKLYFPYEEAPVFIRNGAIIPMDNLEDDFTTVRVYPTKGGNSFGLYEEDAKGAMLSYTLAKDGALTLKSGPTARELLFRVYGRGKPASVELGNTVLREEASLTVLKGKDAGWCYEGGILWVAAKNAGGGVEIAVK